MDKISEILRASARDVNVELDEQADERFHTYLSLLLEWNEKMNLTAITEPEQVAVRHFADSMTLLHAVSLRGDEKVIDVGTGAGFPGVPLKILFPELKLTLLDSLNKRLNFLAELLSTLGLQAQIVHARAEEGGRMPQHREQYDLATARAVASLNLLAEYCLPYVKIGGYFAAMKGPDVEQELKEAEHAISLLGGKVAGVKSFTLPDGSGRSVVLIHKTAKTSDIYPRYGSKIAKKPL